MENLVRQLRQHADFSEDDISLIRESFETRELQKNEVLVDVGEICHYLFYVKSGCIRTFYHKSNGGESTRCLAFPGSFATDLQSFLRAQQSIESIQAVMPSEIFILRKERFDILMQKIPAWERIFYFHLQELCFEYLKRIESFINRNALERYTLLLQQNPTIVQTLPNKIVASYLGIAPESLSRLKHQLV